MAIALKPLARTAVKFAVIFSLACSVIVGLRYGTLDGKAAYIEGLRWDVPINRLWLVGALEGAAFGTVAGLSFGLVRGLVSGPGQRAAASNQIHPETES